MEKISRELGLFQDDVRHLKLASIKKLKGFAFLIMQLKRFNREELKAFMEFCDSVVLERAADSPLDLSGIVIEDNNDIVELSDELKAQFSKRY